MKRLILNTVTALTLTLALHGTASAKPSTEVQQERVNNATVQLKELDARDAGHIATTELGTADAWLEEAGDTMNQRRQRKAFARDIARVEAMLILIEGLLDEDDALAMQAKAQAAADEIEARVRKAAAKADALETRQAELERELAQ